MIIHCLYVYFSCKCPNAYQKYIIRINPYLKLCVLLLYLWHLYSVFKQYVYNLKHVYILLSKVKGFIVSICCIPLQGSGFLPTTEMYFVKLPINLLKHSDVLIKTDLNYFMNSMFWFHKSLLTYAIAGTYILCTVKAVYGHVLMTI